MEGVGFNSPLVDVAISLVCYYAAIDFMVQWRRNTTSGWWLDFGSPLPIFLAFPEAFGNGGKNEAHTLVYRAASPQGWTYEGNAEIDLAEQTNLVYGTSIRRRLLSLTGSDSLFAVSSQL